MLNLHHYAQCGTGKIFVLGNTKSGKSTFAKILGELNNRIVISSSGYIPSDNVPDDWIGRAEVMQARTIEILSKNPNACLEYLSNEAAVNDLNVVFEGLRNPYDFIRLFDPQKDKVFIVKMEGREEVALDFGVGAIEQALVYMESAFNRRLYEVLSWTVEEFHEAVEANFPHLFKKEKKVE